LEKYSEANRDLVYWLFFEIYDYSESVSRQTINKKFCLLFENKTDSDVNEALNFLFKTNMITMVDKEKEIIRITPQGGPVSAITNQQQIMGFVPITISVENVYKGIVSS